MGDSGQNTGLEGENKKTSTRKDFVLREGVSGSAKTGKIKKGKGVMRRTKCSGP